MPPSASGTAAARKLNPRPTASAKPIPSGSDCVFRAKTPAKRPVSKPLMVDPTTISTITGAASG